MSSGSRRVIRHHPPLVTLRIPFEVQPFPPPPTITFRQNLQGAVGPISSDCNVPRRSPVIAVPIPSTVVTSAKNPGIGDHTAPATQHIQSGGGNEMADAGEDDDDEISESDSLSVDSEIRSLIPLIRKPPGEPGRPRSGGFNLEEALGWPKDDFDRIQKLTHDMIKKDLDESGCYNKQNIYKVSHIRDKVTKEFPRLNEYKDCWPITCIMKARLKATSEAARRREGIKKPSKSKAARKALSASPDT